MKKGAITAAEKSLGRCRKAQENINEAIDVTNEQAAELFKNKRGEINFGLVVDAWEDFLIHAGRFFGKLEQGAKSNNTSKTWFNKIKHYRKNDELLKYLKMARNCDEHGIRPVTNTEGVQVTIPPQGSIKVTQNSDKENSIEAVGGPVSIRFIGCLVTKVYDDQYMDSHDVPNSHDGKPMQTRRPEDLMVLALNTFDRILGEAKSLPADD